MEIFGLLTFLALTALTSSQGNNMPIALCKIEETTGMAEESIKGTISFYQKSDSVEIKVELTGFDTTNNHTQHGFHIHAHGSVDDACVAAGGHFNPHDKTHGSPDAEVRHVGDLGNIVEDSDGKVSTTIVDRTGLIVFSGEHSIYGKGIVVHEKMDDLGLGGDEGSLKTGNAGGRLGCCEIYQPPVDQEAATPTPTPKPAPAYDSASVASMNTLVITVVSLLLLARNALL